MMNKEKKKTLRSYSGAMWLTMRFRCNGRRAFLPLMRFLIGKENEYMISSRITSSMHISALGGSDSAATSIEGGVGARTDRSLFTYTHS